MTSVSPVWTSGLPAFCTLPSVLVVLWRANTFKSCIFSGYAVCLLRWINFTNKDKEDEDGPPLKPATLYQGSPNKLYTSVSCPTDSYFLMGLFCLWRHRKCSLVFGSKGILNYSNIILEVEHWWVCSGM